MPRLLVRPEAELDLLEAALWYEGERSGLGEEFIEAVKATLEQIEQRPRLSPSSPTRYGEHWSVASPTVCSLRSTTWRR